MSSVARDIREEFRNVREWLGDTLDDTRDFVIDEIFDPTSEFINSFADGLAADPLATVLKIAALAAGQPQLIPLIDGASVAANGGSVEEVLEAAAISYLTQQIGAEVGQQTSGFTNNLIEESVSAGVREFAVSVITQGTVAATTAIIYGEDPLEAFARGGLQAGVAAGLGAIADEIGWEIEVTDPDTGATSIKPMPNVVKNIVSAALTAELQGKEITPELMAGALSRGILTTGLVRDYIVTNPDVGDREITYITAALQRTAAVALSGGTGAQVAAQILGTVSAYGMEELHDVIKDSRTGDLIGDTLDRISGDYQEVQNLVNELNTVGPRLGENYAEYQEKLNALKELWGEVDRTNTELNTLTKSDELWDGLYTSEWKLQAARDAAKTAVDAYNALAVDQGYLARIEELVPLIEADDNLMTSLTDDLTWAQGNLQRESDRLSDALVPVNLLTEMVVVEGIAPGFDATLYRELNDIPDDVNAYNHFLSQGQYEGAYISNDQYDTALKNNKNSVMNQILLAGFGSDENSPVWSLSDADRKAFISVLEDQGFDTPQALEDLSLNGAAQEQIFNAWADAAGSNPNRQYNTGDTLSDNDLAILDYLGFDTAGVAPGTSMSSVEALALDNYLRTYTESNESPIGRAEGVTTDDILSGNAVITYDDDGKAEWSVLQGISRWDPEYGWVTQKVIYDENGNAQEFAEYDKLGNMIPGSQGFNIYGSADDVPDNLFAPVIVDAAREGNWESIQENLGWTDQMINTAQDMFKYLDKQGANTAQNFIANALRAGGGALEAFNGMSALFGIAPSSTELGKFAQKLQDIGTASNTLEYKTGQANLKLDMNKPSELPVDAPWYERAFETVANIAGAAYKHPSMFIAEYIGVEAMQELIPLAVGGLATLGAKGAAMAAGRTLSQRVAAQAGLTAAAATDLAESFGGTAAETYDRSLEVALRSINPETGQLFTQAEAEDYAMKLAVETGTVAASLTALSLGVGGLSLEKAILNKDKTSGFVADGLDALGDRLREGTTITLREGLTEAIEEGLATAHREGNLSQIDPTIDVSREVSGAAFMGFLVGGPVAGGAYGVSSVGDMYSNFVSAIDPNVRSAIRSGDVNAANVAMDNLGITDSTIRTNILSQVEPENYVNQAQATNAFITANPDYAPTKFEIDSFVQQGSFDDINAKIDRYVDDRYFDINEVKTVAAEEGVTLTDEQAEEYVGQGGEGFSDSAANDLQTQLDPEYTTADEVTQFFLDNGYTPTNEEVQQFVGKFPENTQSDAISNYTDPRVTTEAEVLDMFAAEGYTPTIDEVANYVGQGGEDFQAIQSDAVSNYSDPRATTEAEVREQFESEGYTPTDEEVNSFIGQGGETFQDTIQNDTTQYVDNYTVSVDEVVDMYRSNGLQNPTDEDIQRFVGAYDESTLQDQITDYLPIATANSVTGTIEGIQDQVGAVTEDVAGLTDIVGTPAVADDLTTEGIDESQPPTGIFAEIDALVEAGATRDEAINQIAADLGTTSDNLLEAIGETETRLGEQIGETETRLGEQIAEYESQGLARDEAIQQSVSDLATELGTTEENLLNELGLTETRLGEQIGDTETRLGEQIAEYESQGLARDEAIQQSVSDLATELGITEENLLNELGLTETRLGEQIGDTETRLGEQITGVEETLSTDIAAISDLIGKPAAEVTPTDIDFVVDVIAGNQVLSENVLAQYDVTGDQQITTDDQVILEQLLAGDNVYDQIPGTSIYAPSGIFKTVQDAQTATEQQMQQNQEQTMDTIQQMESNIVTNIEQEALRNAQRQFLFSALQAPDVAGQQVTVKTPDPLNLRYIYDWSSIFATPQQQSMFPSPYSAGGQVEDTTDKLLKIIGGS